MLSEYGNMRMLFEKQCERGIEKERGLPKAAASRDFPPRKYGIRLGLRCVALGLSSPSSRVCRRARAYATKLFRPHGFMKNPHPSTHSPPAARFARRSSGNKSYIIAVTF